MPALSAIANEEHSSIIKATAQPAFSRFNDAVRANLTKNGFDFSGLEALYEESAAEFKKQCRLAYDEALKQSAALEKSFLGELASRRAGLDRLKLVQPSLATGDLFLLDTATAINATGMKLSGSNIEKQNNWAELDFFTDKDGTGSSSVNFTFQWVNPTDAYVVVSVACLGVFRGIMVSSTNGSYWPIDHQHSHSSIMSHLLVALTPSETQNGFIEYDVLLNADTGGGWLGNPGAYLTQNVIRAFIPDIFPVIVPPNETMQIDIVCTFNTDIDSGGAEFNFAGDGRQVLCLGALVRVLS